MCQHKHGALARAGIALLAALAFAGAPRAEPSDKPRLFYDMHASPPLRSFYDTSVSPPALCQWDEANGRYVESAPDIFAGRDVLGQVLVEPNTPHCKNPPPNQGK